MSVKTTTAFLPGRGHTHVVFCPEDGHVFDQCGVLHPFGDNKQREACLQETSGWWREAENFFKNLGGAL